MAGSKGNYLGTEVLNSALGATAWTPPTNVYIALFTIAPSGAGGGTEVSGGGYARVAVANTTTNWPAASGIPPTKNNGAAFVFPTATAGWSTVVAFAIFDAASAGNLLYWGTLNVAKTVSTGDTLQFGIGAITITES